MDRRVHGNHGGDCDHYRLRGAAAMTDIVERLRDIRDHLRTGRFGQREVWEEWLTEAAAEVERLRAVATELHDALGEVIVWYSSGFAPQSQAMALRKANEAMANYRALEPKP